jgi:hypothetical protein
MSATCVGLQGELFDGPPPEPPPARVRRYNNLLTADVNEKGVLDVDTVKGCTAGMNARPGTGCYGGCYAANIARFRGIDFSRSVVREIGGSANARAIERAVANAPEGFFRVGTITHSVVSGRQRNGDVEVEWWTINSGETYGYGETFAQAIDDAMRDEGERARAALSEPTDV